LCKIQQLTELHLGSSVKKADGDSNTFTVTGFKTMLRTLETMQKLTTLDMRLPHVNNIDIDGMGMNLLFNLGVGDKGMQFLV
jgi:hypothetical protein